MECLHKAALKILIFSMISNGSSINIFDLFSSLLFIPSQIKQKRKAMLSDYYMNGLLSWGDREKKFHTGSGMVHKAYSCTIETHRWNGVRTIQDSTGGLCLFRGVIPTVYDRLFQTFVAIYGAVAQLFFDAKQLVVFGHTVRTAQRTGLDLAAVGSHCDVGDGSIFCFARTV